MALKKFQYIGKSSDGRKAQGEIEAKNIQQVKRLLRRKGIRPSKIIAPNPLDIDLGVFLVEKGLLSPFGAKELNKFTRQLAILINAGVPILEGLEILAKQEKNPSLKKCINEIVEEVGKGKSLHESMSMQKGFSKLYCSLVKAGEAAGILDTILNKLAEFLDGQEKIKKQIKSAMTYPSIVAVLGLGITWGLMVFVVPQFVSMLEDNKKEVPWVTQTVIDVSDFIQEYTILMIPSFFVFGIILLNYIKTKQGKMAFDRAMMKVPVIGDIVIKGSLASFTRTLATMLGAGVPIIDSLDICMDTLDNSQMQKDLKNVKEAVVRGKSITEPLGRIKYFPDLVNQMVKVGESTGNLDQMLIKVADVFEEETSESVATMTKLIEPFILVVLGGIIGFVLIAMYLPMFTAAG
ncbi:MAG: type II secretion system F family protein [Bacteriovoracaceae bacterium]|jgi:type IV pilus assembly protein PilC|nr:type II secretion system F family protein [Bacteriovoracaceae bacterium]